jgi:NitT/TauT family transport system substrate-binding protein
MKKRALWWILGGAVLIVGLVLGLVFGLSGDKQPLVVSIPTYPGGGILFVAQQKGYFGDLPVKIQVIDDWRARNSAYEGGKIDVLYSTVDGFAFESAQLRSGKILFATSNSNGADAIVARAPIKTVRELVGKRVAFAEGTTAQFFLSHMLAAEGLTMSSIVPVIVDDSSLAGQAFLAGDVDAAVTWEPFVSQAAESPGGVVVVSTAQHEALIIDVFCASNKALASRMNDLKAFAAACLRAIADVKSSPDSTYKAISDGLNIPLGDTEAMISVIALQDRAGNQKLFGLGSAGQSQVEKVFGEAATVWKTAGLVKTPLATSTVVDRTLLAEVLK